MHVVVPPAGCSGPQWASLVQVTESGPRWQSALFASIRCSDTAGEATPPSLLHAALAWTWEVELVNPRTSDKRDFSPGRETQTHKLCEFILEMRQQVFVRSLVFSISSVKATTFERDDLISSLQLIAMLFGNILLWYTTSILLVYYCGSNLINHLHL